MATLQEIISTVSTLRAGRNTDEETLVPAQWKFLVDGWRSKLLRQEASDGKRLVGTIHEQTITVPLARATNPFPLKGSTIGYKCGKSIPTILHTRWGSTPSFVGANPLLPSAQPSSIHTIRYQQSARLTGNSDRYILQEHELYYYSPEGLETVHLTGIFEDPYAVEVFMDRDDPFSPYDFKYPLSSTHLDALYRGLAETELRMLKAVLPDLTNDGHEPNPQTGK